VNQEKTLSTPWNLIFSTPCEAPVRRFLFNVPCPVLPVVVEVGKKMEVIRFALNAEVKGKSASALDRFRFYALALVAAALGVCARAGVLGVEAADAS
jgi:hypothetical protein